MLPSIAAISDTVEELSINTTLKESSLGFKDILLLFLVYTLPFKNNQNAILQVNGRIFGKLNEIQIL
jgi:hypothetical protein